MENIHVELTPEENAALAIVTLEYLKRLAAKPILTEEERSLSHVLKSVCQKMADISRGQNIVSQN